MKTSKAKIVSKPKSARDRILLTASDLFYREGIRATGVDRLIAESGVTKTTFYRHFPSKNSLVVEFLESRHQELIRSFESALENNGGTVNAIFPIVEEWFHSKRFRGCAFINSLGELGTVLPEVVRITQAHKRKMADIIEKLLPPSEQSKQNAMAIMLAIDGAIIQTQYDGTPDNALNLLKRIVKSLS